MFNIKEYFITQQHLARRGVEEHVNMTTDMFVEGEGDDGTPVIRFNVLAGGIKKYQGKMGKAPPCPLDIYANEDDPEFCFHQLLKQTKR